MLKRLLVMASLCSFGSFGFALEFQSEETVTTVIELFTSEGCSSCPPADKWLSQYKTDPGLFKTVIPMAFHVDYWNYIGWDDPFANRAFSQRQRRYDQEGGVRSVYTPGFVVNGKEWRKWFFDKTAMPRQSKKMPGVLAGRLEEDQLTVTFNDTEVRLNVALLGMGLTTNVTSGENRNRSLQHDFVVLKHWQIEESVFDSTAKSWTTQLPAIPKFGQASTAIVIWVQSPYFQAPIQAAGAFLDVVL
jgi:hypothetical protein